MHSTALPKNLADWLGRSKKEPAKPKRLPTKSAKRAAEDRIYSERRKAFLKLHTYCQAWHVIVNFLWENDREYLTKHAPSDCPKSEEIHHTRKPKQTYYLDESTWLAVSRWAHRWIEDNKSIARKLGLLQY